MTDLITITRIKVPVYLGVPEEERAQQQTIEISLELEPIRSLLSSEDEISNTIDYYQVAQDVRALAQLRPRKLIEKLNEDILKMLLVSYNLKRATITTFKYIIPETKHVSVKMSLSKERLA